ncbi:MAG: DNA-binding domain-containing protein, partial [Gallionellaceae bacterium]
MDNLNDELASFARAIIRGEEPSSQIDANYPNYSDAVAMEVYRNNYRGNLHDALAGAYPVVKQLVGDDFFRFMARKFIEQYPSHSANLHHYGTELPDFLATFAPAQELVYLADVAALEWAYHLAYFVADE